MLDAIASLKLCWVSVSHSQGIDGLVSFHIIYTAMDTDMPDIGLISLKN